MSRTTEDLNEIFAYIAFLCQAVGLPVPDVRELPAESSLLGEYTRFVISLKRPFSYEVATHEWLHYAFDMLRMVGDEDGEDTLEHRLINVLLEGATGYFLKQFEKVYKELRENRGRR